MIHPDLESLSTPIGELHTLPGNPRRGDVEAVMKSYRRFGQRKPIVATPDGTVIAGNHQLEAARRLGWTHIAVVVSDDDELTAQAFALADNRTSDLGTYDRDSLLALLESVAVSPEDLAATSYTEADIAAIRSNGTQAPGEDESDQLHSNWSVVVLCRDEAQQLELLQEFNERGMEVRALVS
jgi:ParB family chromosome partitioning protein